MEFKKCCIECMKSYTYGDYIYFNNITDMPNEHHNKFILKHIQYMYITSPLKFMYEIFESLPNLFVKKFLKMDECSYPNCD